MSIGVWVVHGMLEPWRSFFFFFLLSISSFLFPWEEANFSKNPKSNFFHSNLGNVQLALTIFQPNTHKGHQWIVVDTNLALVEILIHFNWHRLSHSKSYWVLLKTSINTDWLLSLNIEGFNANYSWM